MRNGDHDGAMAELTMILVAVRVMCVEEEKRG
jgi:hypothetical protein